MARGRRSTSDASSSFFVADKVLCRPQFKKKSARNLPKTLFFRFKMFICRSARSLTRLNSNMCSLNPLVTLCRPDCSHCGAVRILCYRSRNDFGTSIARVRSLSAWRRANFDITGATFSALCACQSALAAARCSF